MCGRVVVSARPARGDAVPLIQPGPSASEGELRPRSGAGDAEPASGRGAGIRAVGGKAAPPAGRRHRAPRPADRRLGGGRRRHARGRVRRPGWGKTTLLAQWAVQSPRAFAWVSVDENDNDPIVLLTYVAAALDRVLAARPRGVSRPGLTWRLRGGDGCPPAGRSPGQDEPSRRPRPRRPAHCSTTPLVSMRSRRSRGTCPQARSWPFRPAASRRSRWERCGRAAWCWRSGRTSCAWTRRRPASFCARPAWTCRTTRSRSCTGARRAGRPACTSARCRSGPRAQAPRAARRFSGATAGLGLPAVGAAGAPVSRGFPLPHADRCPRAYVGAALRCRSRDERVRGQAGVAGALQPVPGAAGPQAGVVSLPPPVPGAAAVRAGARRARSGAAAPGAGGRLARGQRPAGDGDRLRTGGRRHRPRGAAGRALHLPGLRKRSCHDGGPLAALARGARRPRAQRGGRRARRPRRHDPGPAGRGRALGRRGRTRELRRLAARRQRLDRVVASLPARAALRAGGGEDARRRGARGADARPRRAPSAPNAMLLLGIRASWPARSTKPTTCSPTSPRRASSSAPPRRRPSRSPSAPRSRSSGSVGRGRGARRPRRAHRSPVADGRIPHQRLRLRGQGPRRAPPRAKPTARGRLLAQAQRLRPRLTYALPYFAVQTRLELARAYQSRRRRRRRRDDAPGDRRDPAPAAGPRHAPGPGGGAARRA